MLLHFKSSDENLKRRPVSSAVVFQSKPKTVMYARGLGGLWYPTKPYLNPHMGMEREWRIDNYRESEMRRWKCKAAIEAQDTNFVFNCMCLIMHEWVLEGDRLRRARETENGRVRLASATPKKTWEKGGIKRGEERIGRERERETQNPRCTQFGNTARCLDNEALPQSQSPHAERQRQWREREGNKKNTFHHGNIESRGWGSLCTVRGRNMHESRCTWLRTSHSQEKSAEFAEERKRSGPGSGAVLIVVVDNGPALRPDVYVTSRGASFRHAC